MTEEEEEEEEERRKKEKVGVRICWINQQIKNTAKSWNH